MWTSMQCQKLVRSKEATGQNIFEFIILGGTIYHMQNAMTLYPCVLTLAPPYHLSHVYFAGFPYISNTKNKRTTKFLQLYSIILSK